MGPILEPNKTERKRGKTAGFKEGRKGKKEKNAFNNTELPLNRRYPKRAPGPGALKTKRTKMG